MKAACKDLPLDQHLLFFADRDDLPVGQQHRMAQEICFTCVSQVECLRYALEHDERVGVWGGFTESQRKRYARPIARRRGLDDDVLTDAIIACGKRTGILPG